ncbi:MAG: hypothetical protein J6W70_09185, partial [Lentisphaeria bacterium]|nr:hypothetical protein [Lentisphaeria bacterium]
MSTGILCKKRGFFRFFAAKQFRFFPALLKSRRLPTDSQQVFPVVLYSRARAFFLILPRLPDFSPVSAAPTATTATRTIHGVLVDDARGYDAMRGAKVMRHFATYEEAQ